MTKSSLPSAAVLLLVAACSDAIAPSVEEETPPPPSIAGVTGENAEATGLSGNAVDFARAMGIKNDAAKDGFGLVSAEFTRGFDDDSPPQAAQHGILEKFGNVLKPREGSTLGVLSTGFAQEFNGADGANFVDGSSWWSDTSRTALPAGYPKAAEGCEQSRDLMDVIVLKLTLKAPNEGSGFKFDFNFHSSEWPAFICTSFNDGFLAYLTSKGRTGNISFDSKNNPVSVNNGFFDRCTPDAEVGCSGDAPSTSECAGGTSELAGTGFGGLGEGCGSARVSQGGATGWLSSSAPIEPGETFTLQLAIWDAGDGNLDSSVLLDNFRWIGGTVTAPTTERPPVDVK